jgi:hypothetical protein
MLPHYSFERKTRLWRKLFFHLFNLVVVNAQILHNKSSKKDTLLEISMKSRQRAYYSLVMEWKFKCKIRIAVQLADLKGETIPYTVFQQHMLSRRENVSTHFSSVQRTRQTRKAAKMYYHVLLKMLCRTLHWAVF